MLSIFNLEFLFEFINASFGFFLLKIIIIIMKIDEHAMELLDFKLISNFWIERVRLKLVTFSPSHRKVS